jgi:hypothetical protein
MASLTAHHVGRPSVPAGQFCVLFTMRGGDPAAKTRDRRGTSRRAAHLHAARFFHELLVFWDLRSQERRRRDSDLAVLDRLYRRPTTCFPVCSSIDWPEKVLGALIPGKYRVLPKLWLDAWRSYLKGDRDADRPVLDVGCGDSYRCKHQLTVIPTSVLAFVGPMEAVEVSAPVEHSADGGAEWRGREAAVAVESHGVQKSTPASKRRRVGVRASSPPPPATAESLDSGDEADVVHVTAPTSDSAGASAFPCAVTVTVCAPGREDGSFAPKPVGLLDEPLFTSEVCVCMYMYMCMCAVYVYVYVYVNL